MSLKALVRKYFKIIVTVAVTILAILGRKYISYFSLLKEKEVNIDYTLERILSQEQLKKYNGIDDNNIYLAVVGTIFDVTESQKHYGKGAPYHYFVGKDGSRGLVTGVFTDESTEKDHILDLSCNELFSILDWRKTFREKYPRIGLLTGRYYDKYGKETDYMRSLKEKLKRCRLEKEKEKQESLVYPPCNISWDEEKGTRVWCTTSSGGVIRNWIGVPRQLYTPGAEQPHCVCVQLEKAISKQLTLYEGCPETSEECQVQIT